MTPVQQVRRTSDRDKLRKLGVIRWELECLDEAENGICDPFFRFEILVNNQIKDIREQAEQYDSKVKESASNYIESKDADELEDFEYQIQSENAVREEVVRILSEQKITTLHRMIEVKLKNIFSAIYTNEPESTMRSLFKVENLKQYLKSHNLVSVDSQGHITGTFNSFNELIQLSNSIKHSGKVSNILEDLNPSLWTAGKNITTPELVDSYNRLKPNVYVFVNEILQNILNELQQDH